MNDSSLRRSSRRSKKRSYSIGDIVEVLAKVSGQSEVRTSSICSNLLMDTIFELFQVLTFKHLSIYGQSDSDQVLKTGQLLSQSTSRSTSPSTWLIGFDDKSSPSEKVHEDHLGEILGKVSPSPDTVITTVGTRNRKSSTTSGTRKVAGRTTKNEKENPAEMLDALASSSSGSTRNGSKKSLVDSESPVPSGKRAAAASAREQRSKRRQAQQPPSVSFSRPTKKSKTSKSKEPAIKIPMLTGTLFLYRGRHRRAEFVRKV